MTDEPLPQKLIIITAPSGSGKTTIVKALLEKISNLTFSISATTRPPRKNEVDGRDYHFLSVKEFEQKIEEDAFAEYEMVYQNKFYGTLKAKLNEIWQSGKIPLVDIDVQGAQKIKNQYQENALSIFIQAPSLEELAQRLKNRGTDSAEMIAERVEKAKHELVLKDKFDQTVVNDVLEEAVATCQTSIEKFISKN
jgi:guanylate kinase